MVRTQGNDPEEQRVIDDVHQFGWHIVGVEDDPEGPAFAYSVGMFHTLNHPEIIIIGLNDAETMMHIINSIGDEIRKGAKFQDWHESDQILDGYSCMFRSVPTEVYPDYLGNAMWFHRPEPFPVLQCVWPDNQHRYPWHPECQSGIVQRQPVLARSLDWPFHEGKNRAAFTTSRVLEDSHPILLVSHDAEGDWQFLCGTTNRPADGKIVCLSTIVDLHPSVVELADLPVGWQAVRSTSSDSWRRIQTR